MTTVVTRPLLLLGLGAILAVATFQLWITPSNPPGYHRDEASISYNAYSISTTWRDEDGALLPLFFRSLEDYKSPLYPYLLAAVFVVTGPVAEVAREFFAVLVLAAVLLLGLLAKRLTENSFVAVVVVVLAGLTPWLFELGRVAIEASTQPLLLVLLLLALERSSRAKRWRVSGGVVVGSLLGMLVYSYTRAVHPQRGLRCAIRRRRRARARGRGVRARSLQERSLVALCARRDRVGARPCGIDRRSPERDPPARAEALWHAVENGVPRDRIVILPDGGISPTRALAFGRFQDCDYMCKTTASWEGYWLARAVGPRP